MSIRIAISGIGGVGGYYGGMLAGRYAQDKDVSICFISRGQNLEMIRKHGLKIMTPESERIVHPAIATDDLREIGEVDYLLCATKGYDLEENIRQLSPVIGKKTVIVPLLNGADITERIHGLLPLHEVWYGCVYIGARLTAPGLITRFTERERLWFGHPQGDRQRQHELLQLLQTAGIAAENPTDIIFRIWRKFFLISLGATLTSFYDKSIGEVLQFHREDYFALGNELKAVATAKGIVLPDDITEQVIADQEKMPYESTTSMHADYKSGKHTEVETLTGYVVRSGKALNIPVPLYEMMYEKLKLKA